MRSSTTGIPGILDGIRMQQVAELADAAGEARARAGVVGVAVDEPAGVRSDALAVEVRGSTEPAAAHRVALAAISALAIKKRDGRSIRQPNL